VSDRPHGSDMVGVSFHYLSRPILPPVLAACCPRSPSVAATPAEVVLDHRTPEYDEPVVRPGAPDMDASLEPGTVPAPEQKGSTEWYEPEKAAEIKEQLAAEHHNPLG